MVTYQYGPKNPVKQFVVVARPKPTKDGEQTAIYRMKVFAPNKIVAKSRFFSVLSKLKKMKRATSELLNVTEVQEKDTMNVKNFGIWVRYNSRSGIHNMYKEFRDVSLLGAVNQLYTDMASRHKATYFNIQIIKTAVLTKKEDLKRAGTQQFAGDKFLKFPLLRRSAKIAKRYRKSFSAVMPKQFGW